MQKQGTDGEGKVHGWLTMVEKVATPPGNWGKGYTKSSWWRCRCGREVIKPYAYLVASPKAHCGCRKRQIRSAQKKIGHDGSCRLQREADGSLSLRDREGKLYGVMRNDRVCRQCGKTFDCYAGEQWAYRRSKNSHGASIWFCSYGCDRKYETEHPRAWRRAHD